MVSQPTQHPEGLEDTQQPAELSNPNPSSTSAPVHGLSGVHTEGLHSREVVESLPLEVSKNHGDVALRAVVTGHGEGGLVVELDDLSGPSNHNDSVITGIVCEVSIINKLQNKAQIANM